MFNKIGDSASTLSQRIDQDIEQAIREKVLHPGDKLPTETELCTMLGVSRTPLREALRRLHARGLITVKKGDGMYVSEPSSENALAQLNFYFDLSLTKEMTLEILRARLLFEPEIVREAARSRTEDDLKGLEESLNDLRASEQLDHEAEAEIDYRFHTLVASSCHNSVVPLLVQPLYSLLPKMRSLVGGTALAPDALMLHYHEGIFASIQRRDGNAGAKFMEEHLRCTEEAFVKVIQLM
jgi:GntR family transcriptional regulator, transcriptional repressor for pyruvate dehydrogenase complex